MKDNENNPEKQKLELLVNIGGYDSLDDSQKIKYLEFLAKDKYSDYGFDKEFDFRKICICVNKINKLEEEEAIVLSGDYYCMHDEDDGPVEGVLANLMARKMGEDAYAIALYYSYCTPPYGDYDFNDFGDEEWQVLATRNLRLAIRSCDLYEVSSETRDLIVSGCINEPDLYADELEEAKEAIMEKLVDDEDIYLSYFEDDFEDDFEECIARGVEEYDDLCDINEEYFNENFDEHFNNLFSTKSELASKREEIESNLKSKSKARISKYISGSAEDYFSGGGEYVSERLDESDIVLEVLDDDSITDEEILKLIKTLTEVTNEYKPYTLESIIRDMVCLYRDYA